MDSSPATVVSTSRLKSLVWNDFDRVKKGDTFVAICRHCKKRLSGSSTSGTSHLRNHLTRCRRRTNHDIAQLLAAREKKKDGTITVANFNTEKEPRNEEMLTLVNIRDETIRNNNFDQKRSRYDLARMIILHGYPLEMVEHVGFKTFVKHLQPLFELVNQSTVERDCLEVYEREKQKVYEVLDKLTGKISLSVDMWTATSDAEYLCLTAHYIDESWQLKKKILSFILVDPSHTEDVVAELIMGCFMDWDIDRKLFSMTFDSFSKNDNIVSRIRDRLQQNRFLLSDGQLFDIRCAANIVNLMVQDALGALSDITHKIRESIQYARSSQLMQEKFIELTQQEGVNSQKCLTLDDPWRWNSTYFMLDAAVEYKDVFLLLQQDDPAFQSCPSDIEWERTVTITGYLKLFVEVTNVFTGTKYQTSNIYFPEICNIHLQLIEWCKNPDEYLNSLALKMKNKFDEFWRNCSLALAIAAILDPRFKMKLVEYYYPQIYGVTAQDRIDDVNDRIKALYSEHALCSPLASLDQGLAWQVSGSDNPDNETRDRLTGFDKFLNETSQNQSSISDLDKYLEEPLFPRNVDFSILEWWKVHMPKYPILSMVARNVLGIPMSKVAFEFAFNTGGRVLDSYRGSLSPNTVQALMCAQDWLQSEFEESKSSSSHSVLALCYDAN